MVLALLEMDNMEVTFFSHGEARLRGFFSLLAASNERVRVRSRDELRVEWDFERIIIDIGGSKINILASLSIREERENYSRGESLSEQC